MPRNRITCKSCNELKLKKKFHGGLCGDCYMTKFKEKLDRIDELETQEEMLISRRASNDIKM
jgi:hypothetical protein